MFWKSTPPPVSKERQSLPTPQPCGTSCREVVAYKDDRGSLHKTSGECSRANERYKEEALKAKVEHVFRAAFMESEERRNSIYYIDVYGYSISDILDVLKTHWTEIRDGLNEIKS